MRRLIAATTRFAMMACAAGLAALIVPFFAPRASAACSAWRVIGEWQVVVPGGNSEFRVTVTEQNDEYIAGTAVFSDGTGGFLTGTVRGKVTSNDVAFGVDWAVSGDSFYPGGKINAGGRIVADTWNTRWPVARCVKDLGVEAQKDAKIGGTRIGPKPADPPKPAPVVMTFTGTWDSLTDGKIAHEVRLTQAGDSVSGSYTGADGSVGKITGKLNNGVLRFSWAQTDGNKGTGRFELTADGRSFYGGYGFTKNPDKFAGTWKGTRR